jgi:amidase
LLDWGLKAVQDEFANLDAVDQAEVVRSGAATPLDLVEAAIARIEALNPELNAVITPLFDQARAQATSPTLPDGPFRGVPMVLKDFICHSAGDPFFEGMQYLKNLAWTEDEDTYLAAKFREAGFIAVAKTNTCELGMTPDTQPQAFGPTRNPWNLGHTPFGSSGGSAAAVASRMVPVGHANDGGGSIRMPAGACGLVGLKPTNSRVSLGPEFGDIMGGLAVEHVVARSVRDSAAVLDAISRPMPGDPTPMDWAANRFAQAASQFPDQRLRVGLMDSHTATTLHPESVQAVGRAARMLEELGHHVEASHPAAIENPTFFAAFGRQMCAGVAWVLDHYWPRRTGIPVARDDVESLTWSMAEAGRAMNGGDFLAGREALQLYGRDIARWFDESGFELLLTPTTPVRPPEVGTPAPIEACYFTFPFNSTGQPAISLPLHENSDGLPIGIQLVARPGCEDLLLSVAAQLEHHANWASRKPPISA